MEKITFLKVIIEKKIKIHENLNQNYWTIYIRMFYLFTNLYTIVSDSLVIYLTLFDIFFYQFS